MPPKPPIPAGQPARPRFKPPKQTIDARFTTDIREFVEANSDGIAFLKTDACAADAVVSATSNLDLLLRIAITATFRTTVSATQTKAIFEGSAAPLSTFDSKIRLCSAFGILTSETKDDIDIIRLIRNDFAHSLAPLNFTTPKIAERCRRLKLMRDLHTEIKPIEKKFFLESCVRLHEFLLSSISFSVVSTELIYQYREELHQPAMDLATELFKTIGARDLLR